ncbi:uncharacterized protein LOC101862648 [Aplysia californica]|uniref:Uncharacterized protein LOC101862648 n=1 Tax=Aplysia californica TaxID=6500 RepID=A0ABM0JP97_APLCA|nr:uncharacterized protein LOC101862648 [Aplysia californica]
MVFFSVNYIRTLRPVLLSQKVGTFCVQQRQVGWTFLWLSTTRSIISSRRIGCPVELVRPLRKSATRSILFWTQRTKFRSPPGIIIMSTPLKGTIVVYSILGCPHCMKAKQALKELDLPFSDVRLDLFPHIRDEVSKKSGMKTVPQIFFNNVFIGGNDSLTKLIADKGKLQGYIDELKKNPMPDDGPVIPDPSTAVADADPFSFQCEPDEYFLLMNELRKDNVIRTHGSFFKSKKNGLTGKDFVKWVKEKKDSDEQKAVEIGQALLDRRFVRGEDASGKFSTGSELFTLVEDDESDALNNGPMTECVPKTANEIGDHLRKMILKLYSVFLSADGKAVDYQGMKASDEFQVYKKMTRELLRVDVESASREEKLAFFINIYNALVIHANIERGPPTNLWGRYKFFNSTKYIIGGQSYSLQDIENGVLRANRKGVGQFSNPFSKDDPRLKVALERHEPLIHFGLVCGAKSCPPIKTYSAQNIYEELTLAAAAFVENDDGCFVDVKTKTVKLSAIFKWYQEDFGSNKKELLKFVASHMDAGQKKKDLEELLKIGNFKVSFLKYDWSVNSKA